MYWILFGDLSKHRGILQDDDIVVEANLKFRYDEAPKMLIGNVYAILETIGTENFLCRS